MFTYTCIAHICGLTLKPNSVIKFDDFIVTNSPEYIFTNLINYKAFETVFGQLEASKIITNQCFIINQINFTDSSSTHFNDLLLSELLAQLWRISDNSIFVDSFFYLPIKGDEEYFKSKLNYNIYNSSGSLIEKEYTESNFSMLINMHKEYLVFASEKTSFTSERENVNYLIAHLSHKITQYNENSKVERALMFQFRARMESSLPIKITNYISFLECLFSSNGSELQHQVCERVALFAYKYNNSINKIDTYRLIKLCYGVRSKYVHGDKFENKVKTIEKLQEVSVKIDNICRLIVNIIVGEKLEQFNEDDLSQYFLEMILNNN